MRHLFKLLAFLLLFSSCSRLYEVTMPFRNIDYSGDRLFPLMHNDSEIAFRAWFNNGSSIDRVITVSYDSLFEYQGNFVEFGKLYRKVLFFTRDKQFYNERSIEPESGFEDFLEEIESLKLIDYKDRDEIGIVPHEPFSFYVIEVKQNDRYNVFRFFTNFPNTSEQPDDKYEKLEKLIFEEFGHNFYIKN